MCRATLGEEKIPLKDSKIVTLQKKSTNESNMKTNTLERISIKLREIERVFRPSGKSS